MLTTHKPITAHIHLGAHLVTSRFLYSHHGVYIGDNQVIHYAGLANGFKFDKVCQVSLEEFCNNQPTHILLHQNPLPSNEIIERAKSRLGENSYHLLTNNCEHFATWCVTGSASSAQVGNITSLCLEGYSPSLAQPIGKLTTHYPKTGLLLTGSLLFLMFASRNK